MADNVIETLKINVDISTGNKKPANTINTIAKSLEHLQKANDSLNLTKLKNGLTNINNISLTKINRQLGTMLNRLKELKAYKTFTMNIKTGKAMERVLNSDSNINPYETFNERIVGKEINFNRKPSADAIYQRYTSLPSVMEVVQDKLQSISQTYSELGKETERNTLLASLNNILPKLSNLEGKMQGIRVNFEKKKGLMNPEQLALNSNLIDQYSARFETLKEKIQGLDYTSTTWRQSLYDIILNMNRLFTDVTNTSAGISAYKKGVQTAEVSTKKLGVSAEVSSKKVSKLVRSLGRIAFYRAIRRAIQIITQALTESIKSAAIFDSSFNQTMSEIKSSWNYLKASVGSTIIPIIQTITPVLTRLMDVVSGVATKIAELFSALNGQDTFVKATKSATNYAKALNKLQNISFDEINVFGKNDNASELTYEYGIVSDEAKNTSKILSSTMATIKDIVNELLPSVINLTRELMPILQKLLEIIDIISPVISAIVDFVSNDILPQISFTLDNIKDTLSFIEPILSGIWNVLNQLTGGGGKLLPRVSVGGAIAEIIETVTKKHGGGSLLNGKSNSIINASGLSPDMGGGLFRNFAKFDSILGFASGGFVDNATLFYANENGIPEMVGRIGNQSAVANNEQIIEGIKRGVSEAMQDSQGDIIIQLMDQNGNVRSEEIISTLQRKNRRDGKTIVPIMVN